MMTAESIDRLVLAMVEASKQPTLALAAMAYASAGVAVFPTKPRTKVPLTGSRGHLDATTDLDQVQEWWAKHPEANIACSPGRSGLLVIDVDGPSREQEDGTTKLVADGRKTWRKLREAAKDTSGYFTTLSPGKGKGQHAWFLYPPGLRVGSPKLLDAPGLQAFGVLGYVMLPPSVHPDGPRYAFDPSCYEVTEVPEWLLRRIPETSTADAPNATDDVAEEFIGARSVNDLDAFWRVAVEAEADSIRDADLRHPALLSSLAKVIGWSTRENVFDLDKALTILRDALRDAVGNEAARSPDKEFRSALKWVIGHELAEIAVEQKTLEVSKTDEWPDLKPLEPPASSAPLEQLPPVIRGVVDTVSAHTQTPPEHALLACLSTISAATVGNAVIDLGWREPGSVWTVSVAEPSDRKSAVLSLVTSTPIATAMSVVRDGLSPQLIEAEAKTKAAAARLAAVEKGMQKESPTATPMDWSQARAELDQVEQVVVPEFLITDATPESIEIAMENQNGAASAVSAEGDLISSLAGRYSDKQARVGPLNSAWSGEPIYIHRVKGNRSIPEPHLSMTMIVQPTVLHKMGSTSLFTESGFAARFLYAKPASKVGYRGEHTPELDGVALGRWTTTVTEVLSRFWGAKAKTVLTIDREGARAIAGLRARVELMLRGKRIPDATRYWLGKAVGQVGRVALMMALSDNPQAETVDVEYVDRSVALFDFFYSEASATFGATVELEGADVQHAESIARWLRESKSVKKLPSQDGFCLLSSRDLTRHGPGKYRRVHDDERFSALNLLEDACYLRYIAPSGAAPSPRGGHPVSDRWVVNPKALSTPSEGRSAAVLSTTVAGSDSGVSAAQEVVQQVQQPRNIQGEEKGGWGGESLGGFGGLSLYPSLSTESAALAAQAPDQAKQVLQELRHAAQVATQPPTAPNGGGGIPDGYESWDEYCNPNLFRKPINAHVAEGYPKLNLDGSCSRCGSAEVHKLNGFVVCTACRTSYTAMVISGE